MCVFVCARVKSHMSCRLLDLSLWGVSGVTGKGVRDAIAYHCKGVGKEEEQSLYR